MIKKMTLRANKNALSTALATMLLLAGPAFGGSPDPGVRIVGTDVADRGWPDPRTTTRSPGLVEAGREAAGAVRALPLVGPGARTRDPRLRAATFELAEILRTAMAERRGRATDNPSELVMGARFARVANGRGRLMPEDVLFDPPSAVRAGAPAPDPVIAAGEPVPVPRPSPIWSAADPPPVPAPRPAGPSEPSATILAGNDSATAIPRARPAPGRSATAVAGNADSARADDEASGPAGQGDVRNGPPARQEERTPTRSRRSRIAWADQGTATTPRLAAATPFITLWPSESGDDDATSAVDRRLDGEPTGEVVAPGAEQPRRPTPYELARMLTALQDDVARGSGSALAAQRVLMDRIAARFTAADPAEWRVARNARALVIYALSGGSPAVVRQTIDDAVLEPPFDALVSGALAYLEGRAGDARRHFARIDDRTLDHSVRGSVFLAQAALAVERNPGRAMELLEKARAAAPASLVEEAALRRAMLVAAEEDDIALLERLVSRYLGKFRRSIYAGNFRQRLAAAVTRMSFIREPEDFGRLSAMLAPMTPAGRQEIYLGLARAAIESGSREAAALAAERALATAEPGTLDHTRATLYGAAAQVVDPKAFEPAFGTLAGLKSEDLPEDDRALLLAARRLSQTVGDLPPPSTDAFADSGAGVVGASAETMLRGAADRPAQEAGGPSPFDVTTVETRVANALAPVDALLEETQ